MSFLIKIIKNIFPNGMLERVRSFAYFNGLYRSRPKVYRVYRHGKRLFLSNTIDITHWDKLEIGRNVFVWHFTILDTFNGIKIGDDCQIGTRVGIFTHSSHNSIRVYNNKYFDVHFDDHKGRRKGAVEIGDCTFIGAGSIIMPGTKIGKGCIVSALSYVSGVFEDFSIISGNPAKKIGDVRQSDIRLLKKNPDLIDGYMEYFSIKSIEYLEG